VQDLLEHPFIKDCTDDPPPPDPQEEEDGSETARSELDEVVRVVKDYYTTLWKRQAKSNTSPTVPNFHPSKLRGLAIQLGLPVETIKLKFSRMLVGLKKDLHSLYSHLKHSDEYENDEDFK